MKKLKNYWTEFKNSVSEFNNGETIRKLKIFLENLIISYNKENMTWLYTCFYLLICLDEEKQLTFNVCMLHASYKHASQTW